jgi:alginate O-acetyltransferase complex protein AlgI
MLFSELSFLFCFLPLFYLFTFLARKSIPLKNYILLVFSIVFYAWGEPVYILLLIFSIFGNYVDGLLIHKYWDKPATKKLVFILGIIFNLGLLGFFKYAGFAVESVNGLFSLSIPVPEITLPIGISFYTFQIMSYVIDLYRGEVKVQKNMFFLGAYLVGFPQLIAGPIVRYQTIADELLDRTATAEDIAYGMRRFIIGLGKKVLIANQAAVIADKLLGSSMEKYGAVGAWLAIIAYTLQIYYDFSGYSDMAIGMGRSMGFHYLENFNYPYIAVSVTDFWRRWHMSLSTFFRDYLYIPLGGNRVSVPRWIFNMLVVWMLTGLWHGASWNFVIWGVYFGVLLILEKLVFPKLKEVKVLNHVVALLLIVIGWTIFRSESVAQIGDILRGLFGGWGFADMTSLHQSGVLRLPYFIAMLCGIIGSIPFITKKAAGVLNSTRPGRVVGDLLFVVVLLLCVAFLAKGSYNPFIYFRF